MIACLVTWVPYFQYEFVFTSIWTQVLFLTICKNRILQILTLSETTFALPAAADQQSSDRKNLPDKKSLTAQEFRT